MKAPAPRWRQDGADANLALRTLPRLNLTVTAYRPNVQNTRQGFVDVRLDHLGLEIRDLVWHENAGKHWACFPATRDEQGRWRPIVVFANADPKEAFQEALRSVMAAQGGVA